MRLFVVHDPRATSTDVSDALFSFDNDSDTLANYIAGCANGQWKDENHVIHVTLEDALKDLCNRAVAAEKRMAQLRAKTLEAIQGVA
jgi:hypothetical protein